MPFNITGETREITKKIGKQSLTLSYLPHRYGAAEQTRFYDELNTLGRKCPKCDAKLPLEEIPEAEREARRKKGQTNGHAMFERAVICEACGASTNPLQRQAALMARWLSENLTEADWEDSKGMIPLDQEAILARVPFEVMMTAFEMIREDKEGKV